MDHQLVVLTFDTTDDAERALAHLQALQAEGFIAIDECALLSRDDQGSVTARNADPGEVTGAAGYGGALGLLVGGVIGLPVLGLLAGAGTAVHHRTHADRLEQLISTVGTKMTDGSGVLAFTVASINDPETVVDRLQLQHNGLVRADIPAALQQEIDRRLQG